MKLGFTLLEVMVAIMIMATMSILTAQTIQRAIRTKTKIQIQIDRESILRNALRIIERDINLAFHYRNITTELHDEMRKIRAKGTKPPPPSSNQPEATPPPEFTQFLGRSDNIHFSSMNNIRMLKDSQESNLNEVGYFLKSCKSRVDPGKSSQCLWRRTSTYIDDDVSTGGPEFVLLENVSGFDLKYFGEGKEEWNSTWETDERGDVATKGNFPLAVEVTIEVNNKGRKDSLSTVIPIRFPNNPEKPEEGGTGANP